jgi:hypothetical protein
LQMEIDFVIQTALEVSAPKEGPETAAQHP